MDGPDEFKLGDCVEELLKLLAASPSRATDGVRAELLRRLRHRLRRRDFSELECHCAGNHVSPAGIFSDSVQQSRCALCWRDLRWQWLLAL